MFRLIIAIIAIPIILAKSYDWITKKEPVDFKTFLLVILAAVTAVDILY
jgi:hypothetical protein